MNFPSSLPSLGKEGADGLKLAFRALPPVGVGVKAVVADHDLALVGNMGSDPGDELQVVQKNWSRQEKRRTR